MTTFASPPRATVYTIKESSTASLAAWAVQRFLNRFRNAGLVEDGYFGPATARAVRAYQSAAGIGIDGIVGPKTQARIAHSCIQSADRDAILPKLLIDGLVQGESGSYLAAVNWSVPGGVDCGLTQRRVYEPYSDAALKRAFDALYQIQLLVDQFVERFHTFYNYSYVSARPDRNEYAWRLAALHHNWPYGASQLALGRALSTKLATWVPKGTRFDDGAPVVTYRDWAKFYAMGSKLHNHRGHVVKQSFGVPRDG